MVKRVSKAVKDSINGGDVASIASVRDAAVQLAGHAKRGQALARGILKIWPDLAKPDFDKGSDKWGQFDDGTRAAYDTDHTAPVAVRDERGRYSLVEAGDDVKGIALSAAYLHSLSATQWGEVKNNSPSLWGLMDAVRTKVGNFVRDNRRNLRTNVKAVLTGKAGRRARHDNRLVFAVIKDTIEAIRSKAKLDLSKKQIDPSDVERIGIWLADGEKLLAKKSG